MNSSSRSALFTHALFCWNWKCALLSATARSLVYLAAMARTGNHGRLAVVLVEVGYVTLTAGLYAGMQQKALSFRSKLLGNLTIGFGVPALAQLFDWLIHHAAGAVAPPRAHSPYAYLLESPHYSIFTSCAVESFSAVTAIRSAMTFAAFRA